MEKTNPGISREQAKAACHQVNEVIDALEGARSSFKEPGLLTDMVRSRLSVPRGYKPADFVFQAKAEVGARNVAVVLVFKENKAGGGWKVAAHYGGYPHQIVSVDAYPQVASLFEHLVQIHKDAVCEK